MRLALFALLAVLVLAAPVRAATWVCSRSSETLGSKYLVTGRCTGTGTYTGTGGDTLGVASVAGLAGAFCGSAQRQVEALVASPAVVPGVAVGAVVVSANLTTYKLQAFTAAQLSGAGAPLAEGDATLVLTDAVFSFVAVCK